MRGPDWSFVQYRRGSEATARVGVQVGDKIVSAPAEFEGLSLMEAMGRWAEVDHRLRQWSPDPDAVIPDARLDTPLTYPAKVICGGANYYAHVVEMGIPRPEGAVTPFFFLKPPTTTIIGPGDPIPIPADGKIDWEAELGLVIKDRCRHVRVDEVAEHIAGYVVANDISAREKLIRENAVSPAFSYDWVASKSQDGFCPIGPGVVPAWQIDDPQNLELRLSVNGEVKQQSSTRDMINTAFDLVAEASRIMTLEPGDIVLTGTAAGVGQPRGTYLAPGDEVVVEIEGVGRLVNPVVEASGQPTPAPGR